MRIALIEFSGSQHNVYFFEQCMNIRPLEKRLNYRLMVMTPSPHICIAHLYHSVFVDRIESFSRVLSVMGKLHSLARRWSFQFALPVATVCILNFCLAYPFSPASAHLIPRDLSSQRLPLNWVQQLPTKIELDDLIGVAGEPIPLKAKIVPASAIGEKDQVRFLMFRGLPGGLRFSLGFQVKAAWAVSIVDLPKLELISPPGYKGTFLLEVTAHAGDGTVIAKSAMAAIIKPNSEPSEVATTTATIRNPPPQSLLEPKAPQIKITPPPADAAEQEELFRQAQTLKDTGLIAAARMIFMKLAEQGNARAAYTIAQTYDPEVMRQMKVIGMQPDVEKAREWYRKAAELGSAPARDRLSALAPVR